MAKFWRGIRNIIDAIPIPGTPITAGQVRQVAQTVKSNPGSAITVTTPAQPQPAGGPVISALTLTSENVRNRNIFIIVAIGLLILFLARVAK